MEELRPEELEELVQELEGESEKEGALSPEVERLLRDLQPARGFMLRLRAARQLGGLSRSSRQIVQALATVAEIDDSDEVRAVAAKSLRAPVHHEYLQEYLERKKATDIARQQHRVARRQIPETKGSAAAESALQQDLDLREMARGAPVQGRIYPKPRIQESSPVARIVGIVIAVGSIYWIVTGALPEYKSDCCSGLFVTVVCGGFAYAGFGFIGLNLSEIIRALLHRREWRGPQVTTDGRIVDLESKEFRDEGEVLVTHWTTFAFSSAGGLVYLKTTIDQSTFRRLRRGAPVKVRYAVENPRLALLGWEE